MAKNMNCRIEEVHKKDTDEIFLVSFVNDKIYHITNGSRHPVTQNNATQEEREMIEDVYKQWNRENN
jgi:hypothetical protein